jgi:hypothetical protein
MTMLRRFLAEWGAFLVLGLLALFALTACAPPEERPDFSPIRFDQEGAISLEASNIRVVDNSGTPGDPPRIESSLPSAAVPANALSNWADDRLNAAGGDQEARFIIRTASFTAEQLDPEGGVSGAFRRDPAEQYTVRMSVEIIIGQRGNPPFGVAQVSAERSRQVLEGTSELERQEIQYQLTRAVMEDFDTSAREVIQDSVPDFIVETGS